MTRELGQKDDEYKKIGGELKELKMNTKKSKKKEESIDEEEEELEKYGSG